MACSARRRGLENIQKADAKLESLARTTPAQWA